MTFKIIKDKKYKEAEKLWKYNVRILKRCEDFSSEYYDVIRNIKKYRDIVMDCRKKQIADYKD